MIFHKNTVIIGSGRICSARRYGEDIVVILRDKEYLTRRKVSANRRVSQIKPKIYSYADDGVLLDEGTCSRYASRLIVE